MKRILSAVTLSLAFAMTGAAQTRETLEVSIINVDFVVTDRAGHRVTGLTRDDFTVLDDGKPQAITNFGEYNDAAATTTVANAQLSVTNNSATPPPATMPRAIVVWIDKMRLPNFQKDPVFASLKRMLHETVRSGDMVTVVHWAVGPSIEVPYTSDLASVDRALDRISADSSGVERDQVTEVEEARDRTVKAIVEHATKTGSERDLDPDDEMANLDIRSAAEFALWDIKQKVAAMNAVISAMPAGTKKALVILSKRLGDLAGGDYLLINAENGPVSAEDRARFSTKKLTKSLIENASSHGVAIYPMFAEGLQTPAFIERAQKPYYNQVAINETASLATLADETGGRMAWSATEVAKALPLIRDDFSSYYSLAYRTPSRFDNQSRKLVVRAKNKAYTVRARRETVERSAATEMNDRVTSALFAPSVKSSIALDLQIGNAVKKRPGNYLVPARLRFPAKSLMTAALGDKPRGAFTVYIVTARTVGLGGDVTHQTFSFSPSDIPADGTFTYDFSVLTDFLSTRIAVALLDNVSGEMGFVRAELPRSTAR